MARALDLPTTIARLNVPYGDNGGRPLYRLEMMATTFHPELVGA